MYPCRPETGRPGAKAALPSDPSRKAPTTPHQASTLPALLRRRIDDTPDKIAYRHFDQQNGQWQSLSWAHVGRLVMRWQQALIDEGLVAGDRVGLLLPNGVDWVGCDQAALALGLIVVPLYMTDSSTNWAYQLSHAEVRLIVLEQHEQWLRMTEQAPDLPSLQRVVMAGELPSTQADDPRLVPLGRWLPTTYGPASQHVVAPDDLATIIYTSGTTGPAKGVMLSHCNMVAAVDSVLKAVPVHADDLFLSYLPLAHAFERIMGYYLPMVVGAEVAFARSIEALQEDLQTIRPTVLLGVPRIYERIYAAVHQKFGRYRLTRKLLSWTERLGWQVFEADQGRAAPLSIWRSAFWSVLRPLIAKPLLARFGGRVRALVSGGAHLSERVGQFMAALGFPLLEGYGLTETAAPVSGNVFADNMIGTVGRPLPGVEVRIADNGELMVRAPTVMEGYWQAPELTKAALTKDGWLHTGDVAEIRDGRIVICGRLKELLVTSTGEKVAPMPIEAAMSLEPLFDQALVIGDGRPFLAAIIVLNGDVWHRLGRHLGLPADEAAALQAPAAKKAVLARLEQLLTAFPKYAQIHAVYLTLESWTPENGRLTTTQKIRRRAIEAHFADAIEELYRGHGLEA